jgi:hypothetical protein
LGQMALEKLLGKYYFIPKFPTLCNQISARCITCAENNASQGPKPSLRIQVAATMPFEDLGVDFSEVKPCQGHWYLLVLVCTYSGWVEAYPHHTEKAREVVKALFKRNYLQIGASLFYWITQWTNLCDRNSPEPG